MSSLKIAKWHPLVSFSPPHITKAAKAMPKLISQSCGELKWIWSHLKASRALVDAWQTSETSQSKSSLGNFQHQYLAELLVVYSYRLMMKSVSMLRTCMHRSLRAGVFSNLVTYLYIRLCLIINYYYTALSWRIDSIKGANYFLPCWRQSR